MTASVTGVRVVAAALCIAAAVVFAPLWAPLVLAAWSADLLGSVVRRLERILGGRRRGAAAVVVLLAVAVLVPLTALGALLVSEVHDLVDQIRAALEGRGSFGSVLVGEGAAGTKLDWADLATRYGANAWQVVSTFARASATAAIAVVVYVFALFTFLADGERAYAWLAERAPIPRAALDRLARAFRETGRGLIVAGGGTALAQGVFATAAYAAIGIPRALLLGPLTGLCAIVPAVGTALVWVPIAIELAVTRQWVRAALVVAAGVIVGVVDNFVRPFLARHGHLALPTFVVLLSMLGGVAVFGATGALLGPLVVRLAAEALEILSDRPEGKPIG